MKYNDLEIYQVESEILALREAVRLVKDVEGVMVEVGVYEGATALIMREESDKDLYLFDTFEGFPDVLVKELDSQEYYVGLCKSEVEPVARLFKDDKKTRIVKGIFPYSAKVLDKKKIAFAHIDVDIYQSTKDALEFIYPKMVKGGVIVIHDYHTHKGVKKAVDDFPNKAEVLPLNGMRQLIIRR